MPNKCCVPGCTGNYASSETVQVFKFPKEEIKRHKWITAIQRMNFTPTVYSVVCKKHFKESEKITTSSCVDWKTGKTITVPLKRHRLHEDAVPEILPNCLTYLSVQSSKREAPEERRERVEASSLKSAIIESEKCLDQYNKKHCFKNFQEFVDRLKYVSVSEKWCVVPKQSYVLFIYIDVEETVHNVVYFIVNEDLSIKVYFRGAEITMKEVPKTATSTQHIDSTMKSAEILIAGNVTDYDSVIIDLLNNIVCKADKTKAINFLKSQISLINKAKERHKFDFEIMIFSSLLFLISRQSYKFLRNSGYVILPHPNTIKNMVSDIHLNTDNSDFLNYIRDKKSFLKSCDLVENLMVDEIHIKPYLDYKGGNIVGMTFDSSDIATTAHVFMIQSIMSPFKDVVHILPVNKIDAAMLFSVIHKVILGLEDIGFKVISVIADNNRINRKAVTNFANPPQESIVYQNPKDNSCPLFFLHDSVHILKCIRNNWLNLKNESLTFCYPDFDDPTIVRLASFAALRALFGIEREKICKFGYGLSVKALWPSSFEKQNVKLVMQIFNENISNSLLELGPVNSIVNYQKYCSNNNQLCK